MLLRVGRGVEVLLKIVATQLQLGFLKILLDSIPVEGYRWYLVGIL